MLYIAVPHTRAFEGMFVDSLVQSQVDAYWFKRLEGHAVDMARNFLVENFLATDAEYLAFIDSDATWAPEALARLMGHGLPMVTGCIYKRGLPPVPTFGQYMGRNGDGDHTYNFGWSIEKILETVAAHGITDETKNAICLPPALNDVQEIGGCGLHFCMIRRDVVEAVEKPWFEKVDVTGAGEDFYFCRKVKAAGFPIYADFSVHTGHIVGPGFDYGVRELLQFTRMYGDEYWDVGRVGDHD